MFSRIKIDWLRNCLVICVLGVFSLNGTSSFARKFPEKGIVKHQKKFWLDVFSKYNSSQFLVHDRMYPNIIIDVVPTFGSYRNQLRTAKSYQRRYEKAIQLFKTIGRRARNRGLIEKRLWDVYKSSPLGVKGIYSSQGKLRVQQGMAQTFRKAKKRAATYLPYMEKVFRRAGLPKELTRIPFIESMFNVKARSKAGAAGIWQLMPYVAKPKLVINGYVDERLSPYHSTKIAAKHLASSFRMLKRWPLAITGYNHGPTGVKKASQRVGSKNIDTIIRNYKGKRFGFASRNFYAEFLAVNQLTRTMKTDRRSIDAVAMRAPRGWSLDRIIRASGLSQREFSKFNPQLLAKALSRKKYYKPRRRYVIHLPNRVAQSPRVNIAFQAITDLNRGYL